MTINDESSKEELESKLNELYKDDIDTQILIKSNLNKLWNAFVKTDKNPIAFFLYLQIMQILQMKCLED